MGDRLITGIQDKDNRTTLSRLMNDLVPGSSKIMTIGLISMLITVGLHISFNIEDVAVSARVITVDDDGGANYTAIQAAIDASSTGDIILIKDGQYSGPIDIHKSIILKGESSTNTSIVCSSDNSITISVSNVKIENLTIRYTGTSNSRSAIRTVGYRNCLISNCSIDSGSVGVYLRNSDISLDDTIIHNCSTGIFIEAYASDPGGSGGTSRGKITINNSYFKDCSDSGITAKVRVRNYSPYSSTYVGDYDLFISNTTIMDNDKNGLNMTVYGNTNQWYDYARAYLDVEISNSSIFSNEFGIHSDYYENKQSIVTQTLDLNGCEILNNSNVGIFLDYVGVSENETIVTGNDVWDWQGHCYSTGDWTLRNESNYNFTDRIWIRENHKLKIEPGTIINFTKDEGEMIIEGAIDAIGRENDPIIFTIDIQGSNDFWKRIAIQNGDSGTRMDWINVSCAQTGIHVSDSELSFHNSTISDCSENGLYVRNSDISANSVNIEKCTNGMFVEAYSSDPGGSGGTSRGSIHLNDTEINDCEDSGITAKVRVRNYSPYSSTYVGDYDLFISNSTLNDNGKNGLNMTVYGNTNQWYDYARAYLDVEISDTDIIGNMYGIMSEYFENKQSIVSQTLDLSGCEILNNSNVGVYLDYVGVSENETIVTGNNEWDWQGHGYTIGDWTFRNESSYDFTDRIWIKEGHELVIEPGTIVNFTVDEGQMLIQGNIEANGYANEKIIFSLDDPGETGYWDRIVIDNGDSSTDLDHIEIYNASTGLRVMDSELSLTNSLIQNCSVTAIYIENSDLDMNNTEILDCTDGIFVTAYSESLHNTAPAYGTSYGDIYIHNSTIQRCAESGLEAKIWIWNHVQKIGNYQADYEIWIDNSTFVSNGKNGLNFSARGYTWGSWEWSYVYLDSHIENTVIENNSIGILTYYSKENRATVTNNLDVHFSEILDNGIGSYSPSSGTLDFDNNTIFKNTRGIQIEKTTVTSKFNNNIICGSDEFGIEADNYTGSVDARYNWWGTVKGPHNTINNPNGTGDNVTDNVLIDPYGYGSDLTPTVGYSGEQFTFKTSIYQYVGITDLKVEYWYENGTHVSVPMTGVVLFTSTIEILSNFKGSMRYFISGKDGVGNQVISTTKNVSIIDREKPEMSLSGYPFNTNTGEVITIDVIVLDNIAVQGVFIEFWYGSGIHFNHTMNQTSTYYIYSINLTISINTTDNLNFRFHGVDSSGNWNVSAPHFLVIHDSFRPWFHEDHTPVLGTTGDPFKFSVEIYDNIRVQNAYVEYWFGSGPRTNTSMTGSGLFLLTIDLPKNSTTTLHYRFHARDQEGNWNSTPIEDVIITDNDGPSFDLDLSSATATTGELFWFSISISDNIQTANVSVEYWFGSGSRSNVSLSGSGIFSTSVSIPQNSTSTLHYVFHANDTSGNWNRSQQVDVAVIDNDRPFFGLDRTTSYGTTGDPFSFNVEAFDNIAIQTVSVEYWYGSGSPVNISLAGSGLYSHTISIVSDSLSPLHYIFHIGDAQGNWNETSEKVVNIIDNDVPSIDTDLSSNSAYTGDLYLFDLNLSDNIDVGVAFVEYWFGTGNHLNVSLTNNGNYQLSIIVPLNSLDPLHYLIHMNDTSNNWMNGPTRQVPVMDNDRPILISDGMVGSGTTGEKLDFSLDVNDNIGIGSVWVEYWFGSGIRTNSSMAGTGPYGLTITLPFDSIDRLYYIFHFEDTSMNWNQTIMRDVEVVDNDLPVFESDSSDETGYTGDEFGFTISVWDNIAISQVMVEYWYGNGDHNNRNMDRDGDYRTSLTIPLNSLDDLHYIFHAMDTAGSWNQTVEVVVDIEDNDIPLIGDLEILDHATTGDHFDISVNVTDNIGVSSVVLEYWFGGSDPDNTSMIGSVGYTARIWIPSNSTDELHFTIMAFDTSWNPTSVTSRTIDVFDNDRPMFLLEKTPSFATTGEAFTFNTTVIDNIEISLVNLEYWYGEGTRNNVSMWGYESFEMEILVPENSLDRLYYRYHARDDSENWNLTQIQMVVVLDNDLPEIISDGTMDSVNTGEMLQMEVTLNDNIGISSVYVEFWFGNGSHENISMGGSGPYVYSILAPVESLEPFHYLFHFNDASDNWAHGPEGEVSILDSIAPVVEAIENITTYVGREIEVNVQAYDNIGVVGYFWIGPPFSAEGPDLVGSTDIAGDYPIEVEITDAAMNPAHVDFLLTVLPRIHDKDKDGIPDIDEEEYGLDPDDPTDASEDYDLDNLTNLEEHKNGLDPLSADTDEDGMPDGWEVLYGLDPLTHSAENDEDEDGRSDLKEYNDGTDPIVPEPEEGESNLLLLIILVLSICLFLLILIVGSILVLSRRKDGKETIDEKLESQDPIDDPNRIEERKEN